MEEKLMRRAIVLYLPGYDGPFGAVVKDGVIICEGRPLRAPALPNRRLWDVNAAKTPG